MSEALIGALVSILVVSVPALFSWRSSKRQNDVNSWDRLNSHTYTQLKDALERIEKLEDWKRETEPKITLLTDALRQLAWKLKERIIWRNGGSPPPPPHSDEAMLEEIEALLGKEK